MIRHFYIFPKKVFPKPRGKGNALYVIDPFLVCNQNWWLLVFILEPVRYEIINACDLCIIVSTENNILVQYISCFIILSCIPVVTR